MGILYITHRLEELPRIGTRVTVMRDGRVVTTGRCEDFARDDLIERMVGRKLEALYPERERAAGPLVAQIAPAAGTPAAGGADRLTVHAGEVVALFGLVGAGRTELVRSLVGADRPGEYRMWLDGAQLRASSPSQALRAGVGLVPEDRKAHGIVPQLSIATNVALSSLSATARGGIVTRRRIERAAAEWTTRLRVRAGSLRQEIVTLSGGNQQKCLLARVLAADPRLVILDEPTRGIDVGARAEVYTLVNEICAAGRAVLMVTSDLPEALGMSDRIYVMRESRLVGMVETKDTTEADVVRLALGAAGQPGINKGEHET
jgi:ABC-type sugar transport system ATPase subunit